ncbi:hypothetical protein SAMN05661044_04638 [Olivibacter domesticus]|uniref:Uncharacterized protein n=1 Tax=Olivibacter domesticus TaxID=407022 RepID=A0A1H7WRP3_OLID1|nr:hypothetical protein SAMN05661044_04638 [Olivibacter domesticus]
MYRTYYLNGNQQTNGNYEVHHGDCYWIKNSTNLKKLGGYYTCEPAVLEAKRQYPGARINGCAYCCPHCHTS